jgi:hypothetical protein
MSRWDGDARWLVGGDYCLSRSVLGMHRIVQYQPYLADQTD